MPEMRMALRGPSVSKNSSFPDTTPCPRSSSEPPSDPSLNPDHPDHPDHNSNHVRRRLSKFRKKTSMSTFLQKWTGSAPSSHQPSRNSSVLNSLTSFGSRRTSRCERDAYITLSNTNKSIVTDDELAGDRVSPARFKLMPVEQTNFSSEAESNNNNGRSRTGSTVSVEDNSEFNQAGGHDGSFSSNGPTLVKKVADREASFYEAAKNGSWPLSVLPKFYGRVGNWVDDGGIEIENLTHGFSKPCVVDLKMGMQTVENDEKSLIKRLKMSTLDQLTGSKSEGCRLEGLSMFRTLDKKTFNVKGSKRQTHAVSMDVRVSLQDMLTFFLTDENGVRTDVALRFQTAIEQILQQFEKNDKFLFIGSSILLIYNNDNQEPHMRWARALRKLHTIAPHVRLSEDQISGLTRRTLCDVRMIDFAHTGPLPEGMVRDEGYIRGLRSILKALKAIRVYRSKPIFSFRSAAIDMMEEQRAKSLAALQSGDVSENIGGGTFTFGTVLKELTAVAPLTDAGSSGCEKEEDTWIQKDSGHRDE